MFAAFAEEYGNKTAFQSLTAAYLLPGNSFCGDVPTGFPAYESTGVYLTGPEQSSITSLGKDCTSEDEIDINPDWYGDHDGDDLSSAAIAGVLILFLITTFLLRPASSNCLTQAADTHRGHCLMLHAE